MKSALRTRFLAWAMLSCAAALAAAGPIEDARAALKAKQYAEVDTILEKLLAQKQPPAEVLDISLQAALATGRYLTAQKRIAVILRDKQTPELLLQGAEIADRAGARNLAAARYLTYATRTKGDSPQVRKALAYLVREGTTVDELKRYVQLHGLDGTAWTYGLRLMAELLQAGETEKYCDAAGALIAAAKDANQINALHRRVRDDAQSGRLGRSDHEAGLLPLMAVLKGKPSDYGNVAHLFWTASRVMPPQQQVDVTFAIQKAMGRPMGPSLLPRFAAMRSLPTDATKIAAGQKFLALENMYRGSKDPADYAAYALLIIESPQVFNANGKILVPVADLLRGFDALRGKPGVARSTLSHGIDRILDHRWLGDDKDAIAAFLRKHITILSDRRFGELLSHVQGEGVDALLAAAVKGRGFNEAVMLRARTIEWHAKAGNSAKVIALAREYMSTFPGTFDAGMMQVHVFQNGKLAYDARLGLLKEIAGKAGYSHRLRDLTRVLAREKGGQPGREWAQSDAFQAFRQEFEKGKRGSDPLMDVCVLLHNQRVDNRRPHPEIQKLVEGVLKRHTRQVPGEWGRTRNTEDVLEHSIFRKHLEHIAYARPSLYRMAETWAPRLGFGSGWAAMCERLRSEAGEATLYRIAPRYIALCGGAEKGDPAVWYSLRYAKNPRADGKSLFAPVYTKMGGENALYYLLQQDSLTNAQAVMDEMAKVVALPGFKFTDRGLANSLIHSLYHRTGARSKPPAALVNALWSFYLAEEQRSGSFNAGTEAYAYGLLAKAGRAKEADAHLARYLQTIQKRDVLAQVGALNAIYSALPREAGQALKPRQRLHTLLKVMAPAYRKTKPVDWPAIGTHQHVFDDVLSIVTSWPDGEPKREAAAMQRLLVDMMLGGGRCVGSAGSLFGLVEKEIGQATEKGDWPRLSSLARYYADILRWDGDWKRNFGERIQPLAVKLQAKGAHEMAYLFLTEAERRNKPTENVSKQIALLKSQVAREIPGLLAVDRSDPAYDLFMAAEALDLGNETRAWELTSPKMRLLSRTWLKLDPEYVAWCVDQMRKQKLLKESLELAFTILLREFDLDAETAASISLTKGDIYRDMQNYQAAKLEYEGLRNNKRYSMTEAGREARYRLIRLLILTKDYATAEGLLERLIDSDNVDTQAEAYHLYAWIAFEQADYQQAKDHLREVFKRRHDHVEARLLEGELKLLVPRGLASTEVLVGNPKLRTIAIPGRPLTLKLQDANLSVARGGAAIPVIVSTSKGGDEEKVDLLPNSSDKNLFTGTIVTALGKVEKGNLQLEIHGDDVVSYIIEPEFQKANDLEYPAKELAVRADARLVASAGEILTEEEAEKRALEMRLREARGEVSRRFEGRSGRTVRPGSPIYVQVTDFDRDVSDEPDKVPVQVETGSGDSVENFELTETGPHTGMFRGAVPTGVPYPRASASDTEEGKDPSVLINATKLGLWQSLADGKAPKWVEVDTMSSHKIKMASIEMKESTRIKQLVLMGMLADEFMPLAVYPKGARGGGRGLTGEYFSGTNFQRKRMTRVDAVIDFEFAKKRPHRTLRGENISVRWTGTIVPRHSEKYNFHVVADDGFRLFVDDKKIVEDWTTHGAAEKTGSIGLEAGRKYDIKLEYFQGSGDAVIQLLWSSKSQKKQLVPSGQMYPVGAEEEEPRPLDEIVATKTGFKTTLMEPVRVRKLRWVFEEFEGNALVANAMAVKDVDGKDVVPVEVDFTTGTKNQTLEISPGDEIIVTYADEKRTREDTPTLEATLDSSYYNGEIVLANEVIDEEGQRRTTQYEPARRCRTGDQLMIMLTDYDLDLTDERDTVPVQVTTTGGEKIELKALETWVNDAQDERHKHSGVFLAVLRMGDKTEKDRIKVAAGESITVSYLDKENTEPGVPIERAYTVSEAGESKPETLVYRTTIELVEDDSEQAEARIRQMRMRGRDTTDMVITRPQVIATHPDYTPEPKEGEAPPPKPKARELAVSVNAPLLLEVAYPKMALNSGSSLDVTAIAESEIKAAAAEQREPRVCKVPMYIKGIRQHAGDKGYRIELNHPEELDDEGMLDAGSFSGVIRLQIGSPGDTIDDLVLTGGREFEAAREEEGDGYRYRVATIIVSGSDVVHIKVKDVAADKEIVTDVRLLSDARLQLLDSSYTAEKKAIHLGEKFFIMLSDPDHDKSDEQDTVTVQVAAASGDTVALPMKETLPHSGIFTGSIKPEFVGEGDDAKGDPKDQVLSVRFGDDVTVTFHDETSLASDKPMDVVARGKVHFGSDSELAGFTKRFKDPDMAVKTRFLMAEALFEMAKEHRKLKQTDLADEEIGRGKRILEEAMRDYPSTSLAAQGEFLLANLAQELGRHTEAIGRYSNIISNWPDSEYAPRSQFKKAICLEKMENYDQACEEYVKLTYIYPDSTLVADATIRLGNYYYKQEAYKVAGRIFYQFQQRSPEHTLAVKSLFLSAQCYTKLEDFKEAIKLFTLLIDEYPDEKDVRAEAMYWLGDSHYKARDYVKAYQSFKKLTWDYPETKWAKIARGRLTDETLARFEEDGL